MNNSLLVNILKFILFIFPVIFYSNKTQAQETFDPPLSPAVVFLSEYISIPSETGNENEAAYFLMQACEDKGLHLHIISDTAGSVNFAASLYPLHIQKPNIIFLNHIDVVPAGDHDNWIYPPYSGTIAKGKVWGRGALDNKGIGVIQLFATEKFIDIAKEEELPYNVTILFVSGEETGGEKGSAIVAKNFKETFNPVVVIGEGGAGIENIDFLQNKTFFGISIAEKRLLWLKLSYNIQSAGHASVAWSDYAYKRLIRGFNKLVTARQSIHFTDETKLVFSSIGKQIGGIKGFAFKNIDWKIFRPFLNKYIGNLPELRSMLCNTFTITDFGNLGSTYNQHTMEVSAILDCRLLPGFEPKDMIEIIHDIIKDSLLTINIVKYGYPQFTSYPEYYFNKLALSIKNIFTNSEVIPFLLPASTDNSYFRASGCPVYGLSPMIIAPEQMHSVHNYNEYIDIEDVEKGILVFEDFLHSLLINF